MLENEEIGRDAFRGFALLQPVKAASGLRRLATRGNWPASIWQGFLWGLDGLREKPGSRTQDARVRCPSTCRSARGTVRRYRFCCSGLVKDLAEQYGIDRESELTALWMKAWGGIGKSSSEAIGIEDALTHAAGKLAEAALMRLWKYELTAGSGLPSAVRPYFDALGSDPDGQLGRVMLATRLHRLFAVDPDWSREHLISRLGPMSSEEAGPLCLLMAGRQTSARISFGPSRNRFWRCFATTSTWAEVGEAHGVVHDDLLGSARRTDRGRD